MPLHHPFRIYSCVWHNMALLQYPVIVIDGHISHSAPDGFCLLVGATSSMSRSVTTEPVMTKVEAPG